MQVPSQKRKLPFFFLKFKSDLSTVSDNRPYKQQYARKTNQDKDCSAVLAYTTGKTLIRFHQAFTVSPFQNKKLMQLYYIKSKRTVRLKAQFTR